WAGLERLTPLAKLDLLCETLKVKLPGKDKRPRQTLRRLFKFRNTLAHGRTETIDAPPQRMEVDKVDEHFGQRLLTEWEQLIRDHQFAERAREDVEAVVQAIHAARPEPKDYPFTHGIGIDSATLEGV